MKNISQEHWPQHHTPCKELIHSMCIGGGRRKGWEGGVRDNLQQKLCKHTAFVNIINVPVIEKASFNIFASLQLKCNEPNLVNCGNCDNSYNCIVINIMLVSTQHMISITPLNILICLIPHILCTFSIFYIFCAPSPFEDHPSQSSFFILCLCFTSVSFSSS